MSYTAYIPHSPCYLFLSPFIYFFNFFIWILTSYLFMASPYCQFPLILAFLSFCLLCSSPSSSTIKYFLHPCKVFLSVISIVTFSFPVGIDVRPYFICVPYFFYFFFYPFLLLILHFFAYLILTSSD